MKKLLSFLVVSLVSLFIFTSCDDGYYKWKGLKGGGQYQRTRGTLYINNEVKTASLDIYITYVDSIMKIQFRKQARYFDENDTRISLVNNESNEEAEGNLDYILFSRSSDSNTLGTFENTGDNLSKDQTVRNVLILSRSVSNSAREFIKEGKGCDVKFKDGDKTYQFRIYKQGLK